MEYRGIERPYSYLNDNDENGSHCIRGNSCIFTQKVKVQYQAASEDDKKAKRDAVAQVILQALKRMREKK